MAHMNKATLLKTCQPNSLIQKRATQKRKKNQQNSNTPQPRDSLTHSLSFYPWLPLYLSLTSSPSSYLQTHLPKPRCHHPNSPFPTGKLRSMSLYWFPKRVLVVTAVLCRLNCHQLCALHLLIQIPFSLNQHIMFRSLWKIMSLKRGC